MKRIGNDKETRRILAQKLNETYGQESTSANPFGSDVDRLIEAAEAEYARQQKAKKRRRLGSVAAVFVAFALMSSGYILGMKADVQANADPDDETKVVQQGDNIVIGSGVSEDDENVGTQLHTFHHIKDIPEEILERATIVDIDVLSFDKVMVRYGKKLHIIETHYNIENDSSHNVVVSNAYSTDKTNLIPSLEKNQQFNYNNEVIYMKEYNGITEYSIIREDRVISISGIRETDEIEIEAILEDLLH